MQPLRAILTALIVLLSLNALSATTPSLSELENRFAEVDHELNQLAHYSLSSDASSIGHRSMWRKCAESPEWIEIDLEREVPIDQIVLAPILWRDSKEGFQSDGFPEEFQIVAGGHGDSTGHIIAKYGAADHFLPRIAPLVIPCNTTASWVRIEATQLGQRAFDKWYILQLAEIFIFSGEENVALHRPVRVSSFQPKNPFGPWGVSFLTDGYHSFMMDAARGAPSLAFSSKTAKQHSLTVDLETTRALSRVHLHKVDQSSTAPIGFDSHSRTPHRIHIEGSTTSDFEAPITLIDTIVQGTTDVGPIMAWQFPETSCRFVRISESSSDDFSIAFAEIELFAQGINCALNKTVTANHTIDAKNTNRSLTALTDGRNLYGNILSIRSWVNQLARRHDLEREQTQLEEQLAIRYARQKLNLRRMSWMAALFAIVIVLLLLIQQVFKQRAIYQTRERIAANLHDELGANLNAIALLGDYAQDLIVAAGVQDQLTELSDVVSEVRQLTEETGQTARHCTNLLEATGHYQNLVHDITRSSQRLLADIEHQLSFSDEERLANLPHRKRIDLALFYKECLNNIVRHSQASEVITQLTCTPTTIVLSIQDNGQGLPGDSKLKAPNSIKRRAKLAGGTVRVSRPTDGGTLVTLRIRTRRFWTIA